MGKFKIKGNAEKEFIADLMKVNIEISTLGETSASAIGKGKKESEKTLKLLSDLKVELSKVSMTSDKVLKPYHCNDDKFYHFEKNISFVTAANLTLLEALSDGIIQNEINATYNETFYLSNVEAANKAVIKEALLDAKKKAEALAQTLEKKVFGIESATCDDYEAKKSLTKSISLSDSYIGSTSLATKLSPDVIRISKSIDTVWIID